MHTKPPSSAEIAAFVLYISAHNVATIKVTANCSNHNLMIPSLFNRLFTYSPSRSYVTPNFHCANCIPMELTIQ